MIPVTNETTKILNILAETLAKNKDLKRVYEY